MDALTPRHQDIADLVLAGRGEEDIALAVGRPLDYVRGIVRSPLFQLVLADTERERIADAFRRARMQTSDLLPLAIAKLGTGLNAEREGYQYRNADRLAQLALKLNAKAIDAIELTDRQLHEKVAEARGLDRANAIPVLATPSDAPQVRVRELDDVVAEYAESHDP